LLPALAVLTVLSALAAQASCSSGSTTGFGGTTPPPEDSGNGSSSGADASSSGGSSGGAQEDGAPPADASDAHSHADSAPLPPSSFDVAKTFAGSYAAQVKFRKVISLNGGALGSFNALAAFYMTLQLTADATNKVVNVSENDCHADLTGSGTLGLMGATLQLPDAVMTTTHLDGAVFSASTSGSTTRWAMSEIHGPMGWHWTSPTDTLPSTGSDSRIFDQDMDGNPGVTFHVFWSGTDYPLYVVQTQRDTLSGTAAANGTLTGTTVDATAINVIGNTTVLGGATVSWAADSNTADNTVKMVKTSSLLTCAQLASQTSTLFP
jgi:hypothetical protein